MELVEYDKIDDEMPEAEGMFDVMLPHIEADEVVDMGTDEHDVNE